MNALSANKENGRLLWIDFGRAVGMLIVLLVHAGVGPSVVRFYGGMFYMPIFFMAAGCVYHRRAEEPLTIFIRKKARRLLLPYFGASFFLWLFFCVKDMELKLFSLFGIFYSRNQMYRAGFAGKNPVLLDVLNAPLWFLTALFLVYLWYEIAERSGKKKLLLALGLLFSLLWHYGTELLLPWSLDAVPYFACFFFVGEELREGRSILEKKRILLPALILFFVSARLNGSVNLSCGDYGASMLLYLLTGSQGSFLVFVAGAWLEVHFARAARVIALAGQETLTILCFHMFLFMFIRAGAAILGLGEILTDVLLIAGSLIALTAVGHVWHIWRKGRGKEK
ncbi:MAG: acyltransferase family protein [Lachnospiraceae bacterium]|nr:acyltransferase family protein [Lachnospiraceae bacterium]